MKRTMFDGCKEAFNNLRRESHRHRSTGFISVGAVCQRLIRYFSVLVERIVLFVLRLKCLVKRKGALRGRNLSRP